jgi:FkbM family methyltransferase
MTFFKNIKKKILIFFQLLDHVIAYLFSNIINEKKILKGLFKKKKIIYVDIGTNLGSSVSSLSSYINIKEAFLFEPNKECFEFLKSKFKEKKYNLINEAIGTSGKKLFYDYKISSQSGFLKRSNKYFKGLNNIKGKCKIKLIPFDYYFKKKKIDFCKIDVEGMEYDVLKSMRNSFKNITLIKIEINFLNDFFINKASNFNEIINFLCKKNFKLYSVSKIKHINKKIFLMDIYFINSNNNA